MYRFSKKEELIDGIKKGIPIGVGYLAVSFTFGIWATEGGIPLWMAVLISFSNLTSAGQFAGVGLIMQTASLFEIGLSVFVINIRYSLMSLSLTQKLEKNVKTAQKYIFGFGITYEVFAIAAVRERPITAYYMYGLMTTPIIGWTLGTFLGGLVGNILPPRLSDAMGIALYAMFIAIIVPPAKKNRAVLLTIIIAVIVSFVLKYVPVFDFITDGFAMIIATFIGAGIMAYFSPIKEKENEEEEEAS